MPTLDLFYKRVTGRTKPWRATHNAVCLVVSGERPLDGRRPDLRVVAARRVHGAALDLVEP